MQYQVAIKKYYFNFKLCLTVTSIKVVAPRLISNKPWVVYNDFENLKEKNYIKLNKSRNKIYICMCVCFVFQSVIYQCAISNKVKLYITFSSSSFKVLKKTSGLQLIPLLGLKSKRCHLMGPKKCVHPQVIIFSIQAGQVNIYYFFKGIVEISEIKMIGKLLK